MEKSKRGRRHHNWNNKNSNNGKNKPSNQNFEPLNRSQSTRFHYVAHENVEAQQKRENAIRELKTREIICPKCNEKITDMASAIADKASGKPMHFECVMKMLGETEKLGQGEKLAYIGQGRFAVLYYENIRDQRHFQIKKTIDFEDRDNRAEWRTEMSSLYSQVEQ